MKVITNNSKHLRHVRYVRSIALDLTAAKTALAAIHLSMWGHSSNYALWSRMEGRREGDALLAAKAHDALLPQYAAALDKVSGSARLLTGALVDFANRWESMPVRDAWLIPEVNHHCGAGNHWAQTWRMPHCVLCRNRVSSQ